MGLNWPFIGGFADGEKREVLKGEGVGRGDTWYLYDTDLVPIMYGARSR